MNFDAAGRPIDASGQETGLGYDASARMNAGVLPGTDPTTARTLIDLHNERMAGGSYGGGSYGESFMEKGHYLGNGVDPMDVSYAKWLREELSDVVLFVPRILGSTPPRGSSRPMTVPDRLRALVAAPFLFVGTTFKALVGAPFALLYMISHRIVYPTARLIWPVLKWLLILWLAVTVAGGLFLFFGGVEWLKANTSPETEQMLWEWVQRMRGR